MVEQGQWLTATTGLLDSDTQTRRLRCHAAAISATQRNDSSEEDSDAHPIHRFLPSGFHAVALCTNDRGQVRVVGSAALLRDQAGPCLVTAMHVLSGPDGFYREVLRDAGLMVLTMSGKKLVLRTRAWALYEHVDVAVLELTEDEVQLLGGALPLVWSPGMQMLWVGYGFPASRNRQKHRAHPFALHGNRIVLYDRAEPPRNFGGDPEHHIFFKYDLARSYVPSAKRQQPAPNPAGCSGGLVAAYINDLACWMPLGVIVEWHQPERTLVVSPLDRAFGFHKQNELP